LPGIILVTHKASARTRDTLGYVQVNAKLVVINVRFSRYPNFSIAFAPEQREDEFAAHIGRAAETVGGISIKSIHRQIQVRPPHPVP
jgi:hypothetical protein